MENNYFTPSELPGAPDSKLKCQFNEVAANMVGPLRPDGLENRGAVVYDASAPPSLNKPQKNEGGVGFEIEAHRTSGARRGNFLGAEISFPIPDTFK